MNSRNISRSDNRFIYRQSRKLVLANYTLFKVHSKYFYCMFCNWFEFDSLIDYIVNYSYLLYLSLNEQSLITLIDWHLLNWHWIGFVCRLHGPGSGLCVFGCCWSSIHRQCHHLSEGQETQKRSSYVCCLLIYIKPIWLMQNQKIR